MSLGQRKGKKKKRGMMIPPGDKWLVIGSGFAEHLHSNLTLASDAAPSG